MGGFSHEVLLGVLPRLAGADMTIFPSFGGRFGFSVDECKGILHGSRRAMGTFPEIFPTPGGGMTMERVAKMVETFGADICLLIGGSLMGHSPDLVSNAKHFMGIAGRKDLWGPKEQIRALRASVGSSLCVGLCGVPPNPKSIRSPSSTCRCSCRNSTNWRIPFH